MNKLNKMVDACGDLAVYTARLVSKGIDVKLIYAMLESMSVIAEYSANIAFQATVDDLPWDKNEPDEALPWEKDDTDDNNADILSPEQYEDINRRLADTKDTTNPSKIIHTEKELRAKAAAYLYMIAEYLYKGNNKSGQCLDCEAVDCPMNDEARSHFELFCEDIKPTVDELTELMAQAHLQRIETGTLAPDEVWERMIMKGEKPDKGAAC